MGEEPVTTRGPRGAVRGDGPRRQGPRQGARVGCISLWASGPWLLSALLPTFPSAGRQATAWGRGVMGSRGARKQVSSARCVLGALSHGRPWMVQALPLARRPAGGRRLPRNDPRRSGERPQPQTRHSGHLPPGLCSGPRNPAWAPRAACLTAGKCSRPPPEIKPARFSLSDCGGCQLPHAEARLRFTTPRLILGVCKRRILASPLYLPELITSPSQITAGQY